MAKAPRPVKGGRDAKAKEAEVASRVTKIEFRGHSYLIAVQNVPISEKAMVRAQAHMAWHEVTGESGIEADIASVAVLVWIARRLGGEPNLSWFAFCNWWDEVADGMGIAEVEASVVGVDDVADVDAEPDAEVDTPEG